MSYQWLKVVFFLIHIHRYSDDIRGFTALFIGLSSIEKAKNVETLENRIIKIGSSFLNSSQVLTDLWKPLKNQFPEYKFNLIPFTDDHDQILSVVKALGTKYDLLVGTLISSYQMYNYANSLQLGTYDLCVAVPQHHPLAQKKILTYEDMYGEHLMMVNSSDTAPMTDFHDFLQLTHPAILLDFVGFYYDVNTFNLCERTNSLLLTLDAWEKIHPSLVTIPVEWDFKVPYGIMYAKEPSDTVASFIEILKDRI